MLNSMTRVAGKISVLAIIESDESLFVSSVKLEIFIVKQAETCEVLTIKVNLDLILYLGADIFFLWLNTSQLAFPALVKFST